MYLNKIIEKKRIEVEQAKKSCPINVLIKKAEDLDLKPKSLYNAINKPHHISLIAEIKRKSPSSGVLKENLNPVILAQTYEVSGASAISVLTDEEFFGGSLKTLEKICSVVGIPVLRKDFIIDEHQIYQSYLSGSDAILLISSILSCAELEKFSHLAHRLKMQVLCEVHTREDLQRAIDCKEKIKIIGINNRNLETFFVDIKITESLIRHISKDRIVVSESGIRNYEDVMYLWSLGVKAVLVGETIVTAPDPSLKIRELMGG
jgi:indole-3-glycerol phosphate synthase